MNSYEIAKSKHVKSKHLALRHLGRDPMRRIVVAAVTGFWLCCALFFGWLFYDRYWRLLDCFNELGRCFDPESETVAKDSNFVYGLMAALALVLALLTAMIWQRLRNRPSSGG
jgi:hypothetical protein